MDRGGEKPGGCAAKLCALGTLLCCAGLLPALAFVRVVGERSAIAGGVLYLPHAAWCLPFVILGLASAFAARGWILPNALAAAAVALVYADFSWGKPAGADGGATLVVGTNNIGQNNRQSPVPFFEAASPDIVLTQEGHVAGKLMAGSFPGYFRESLGEFAMASRHPILAAALVRVGSRRYPVAARFEVAAAGKRVAIYNVHLPTPRGDLLRIFSPETVGEILDPSAADGAEKENARGAMRERVRLGRELAAVFAGEKLPMIAAGDFNMPGNGYLRRVFSGRLRDAHASAGFGHGFTFPGYTRNPVSFFGPWLRLDYVFCSREWRPLFCRVEGGRPSQHRAVLAGFRLAEAAGRAREEGR